MFLNPKSILLGKFITSQVNKPTLRNKIESSFIEDPKIIISTIPEHMGDAGDGITENLASQPSITESEKLIDITAGAQDYLVSATNIFPFVLFPDTINIDRQKITIVRRATFRTAKIVSVRINDILNVEATVGPLFGSIKLTSKYFSNNTQTIKFLRREDVTKIQRLLQGSIIAQREKIDCTSIDKDQLVILLNDLGQGSSD